MSQRLQESGSSTHSPKWITDFKDSPQTPPPNPAISLSNSPDDSKEMHAITKREDLPQADPYTFDIDLVDDLEPNESLDLATSDEMISSALAASQDSLQCEEPLDAVLSAPSTTPPGAISLSDHPLDIPDNSPDGSPIRPVNPSPRPLNPSPRPVNPSPRPAFRSISASEEASEKSESALFDGGSEVTDESLELFQDLRPSKRQPPPPRPPPPTIVSEEHPLMMSESPDPPEEPIPAPSKNFRDRFTKGRERFTSLKQRLQTPDKETTGSSPDPSVTSLSTPEESAAFVADTSTPPPPADDASSTTSSTTATKVSTREKFRKFKKKGSNYLHDWKDWYYGKGKEMSRAAGEEDKALSESSDFAELNADDVAETEGFDEAPLEQLPPSSQRMSEIRPVIELQTVTPPSGQLSGSEGTPTWVLVTLLSLSVLVVAVATQLVSPFLQGLTTGALLPCLVWLGIKALKRGPTGLAEQGPIPARKSVLTKTTLQGFFHYTETRNFGEINFKRMPYRFVKVEGTEVEVYETGRSGSTLAPCLDDLENYDLKLSFKLDITGWDVSVEPLPGTVLTVHNKWRKKYPIWVRRPTWRQVSSDMYHEGEAAEDVPSFYLFAVYSRDKEYWYEELKRRSLLAQHEGGNEADNYLNFMSRIFGQIPHEETSFLPADPDREAPTTTTTTTGAPGAAEEERPSLGSNPSEVTTDVAWINALFGRFCWNIMSDEKWEKRIRDRIVRKLSGVQTKYIYSLALKSFDLGNTVPLITQTYQPKIDEQGVWTEMDMQWSGLASLTLVAKLNASKDKGNNFNSEQMRLESPVESKTSSTSSRLARLYNLLDRLEVVVSARVTSFSGRLCVNIAPPPTDCIWYGFKEPPVYNLQLEPVLWKISLEYPFVTRKIEKQLRILFNETFVLPAMENIVIPGMSRSMELHAADRPDQGQDQLLDVAC